jgi:hypothetical protein
VKTIHYHRYTSISTFGEPLAQLLLHHTNGLLPYGSQTAANVFDAIGLIREGIVRQGSRFKIDQIGPVRFNEVIDWLAQCGYPVDGLRIAVKRATA